ncbi:signal peptidase I [Streptomyces flavotricini]|uniref:Signal peptidase I n=1 Tax=Streptomyces flavotricini TaxID=66888 RepID=A0ABS8E3K8_9ACTN|nr:signal peptidase I [Streptomyces flavotricini]
MGSRGRPRGGRVPEPDPESEPRRTPQPTPTPPTFWRAPETPGGPEPRREPEPAAVPERPVREPGSRRGAEARPVAAESGGRAARRRLARRVKRRRRTRRVGEVPLLIIAALCIALVLKTFLVQAFFIPSGSMEQTIRIGDRVLVDKLTPWFGSKIERGDVVVFKDPGGWLKGEAARPSEDPVGVKQIKETLTFIGLLPSADEQDLIKRVIGVGGDTVMCCDAKGRVTVNGTALDEPYVSPGNAPSEIRFEVRVPKGRIFVMGDHRANSADSRYHLDEAFDGTIDEGGVVGQAVVIAWPFDHWRKLEQPATFRSVPDPAPSGRRGRRGRRRGPPFA